MNNLIIVRKKLIKARKKRNLTQNNVAELLGISRSYVSQIENGKKNPSHGVSKKISTLFSLNINDWD